MRTTILTIIGLLATLAIGWFVLDTALWLLGWKRTKEIDADDRREWPENRGK
jgi:hypothetical protein